MYQSGDLFTISDDDPKFDTENAASDFALEMSEKKATAYGVWDLAAGSRLLYIAYEGWLYKE